MGGRPVSQQGIPYANLLAMPQYSHHSNPQYIRPSSAAPEMEHKPNPEALLAYIRQGAAASSAARPVVQNPSQQMVPPFQGQGQVLFSGFIVNRHDLSDSSPSFVLTRFMPGGCISDGSVH